MLRLIGSTQSNWNIEMKHFFKKIYLLKINQLEKCKNNNIIFHETSKSNYTNSLNEYVLWMFFMFHKDDDVKKKRKNKNQPTNF